MSEISTLASSWPSKSRPTKDEVFAESLGASAEGGVSIKGSGAPHEDEDFEPRSSLLRTFSLSSGKWI